MKKHLGTLAWAAPAVLSALAMHSTERAAAEYRGAFYIQALGNRCLDLGNQASWKIGGPVNTYGCSGTAAQQVRVVEVDASHDVQLQVPGTSLCLGVRDGVVAPNQPLELQSCTPDAPYQRFALDGDAIIMGPQAARARVQREYVIEPSQGRTAPRTPLVVGTREASDAEYFRFRAVDGSAASPTTGFRKVSSEGELDQALSLVTLRQEWGAVIEVQTSFAIDASVARKIPAGTTLRGYRKLTDEGPELYACTTTKDVPAFLIEHADQVRITGLRLRGAIDDPRCSVGWAASDAHAIRVLTSGNTERALIDHVESSFWTGHSVDVRGPGLMPVGDLDTCPVRPASMPRQTSVRAIGNFSHHNFGSGFAAGAGAFVLMQGNLTASGHAHSFAADARGDTGYLAFDNFVLRKMITDRVGPDFDVHGGLQPGTWTGGAAGDYFDIGWNTVLATDERNLAHRGTPCRDIARAMNFHDNVLLRSESESIQTLTKVPARHDASSNFYKSADPTGDLAAGDFDGDDIDDVFVGTGAGWYFSSGGSAEWRFLNRMPEHASDLLFGDFDGDRRTDVLALHDGQIDISWAGGSPWQTVNVTDGNLTDLAVGDFDGDRSADLFLATGSEWFKAASARNWVHFAYSSYRTKDLAFGNFTAGDRITDVLGYTGNQWQVVANGGTKWQPHAPGLLSTLAGVVVGDFDGDGVSDVARTGVVSGSPAWQFSSGAKSGWTTLRTSSPGQEIERQPVGRFDGDASSDVILWDELYFEAALSGRDPVQRQSRQSMR